MSISDSDTTTPPSPTPYCSREVDCENDDNFGGPFTLREYVTWMKVIFLCHPHDNDTGGDDDNDDDDHGDPEPDDKQF